MKDIYVSDLINVCSASVISGSFSDFSLGNICTDSRKINKGDVYFAIRGEVFDGNDFCQDAIDRGASCCVIDKMIDNVDYKDATVLVVKDTVKCLQDIASYKRDLYDIPVIAVTGSAGKTSTKDIIYSVVSKKYKTHKTYGNLNNHIGLPLTILSMRDHEALVVEMGMNHLGEISLLSKISKPTISVITNVGTAHIGNLGSRENILKAKLEILDGMIGYDIIVNNDNDMLSGAVSELEGKYKVYTVGIENESYYMATNVVADTFGSKFYINNKEYEINVGGVVNIYNALMAYTVGKILNIDDNLIKEGIYDFKLTGGRLEKKINKNGATIIDDTYNANYDSVKSSVELLGCVKNKRKIAILGDMLELGEYSDELHSRLGDVVVNSDVDILITIGEFSKNIDNRVIELGFNRDNLYHFDNVSEVSYDVISGFVSDDVVLIKGSHGMKLFLLVDRIMNL